MRGLVVPVVVVNAWGCDVVFLERRTECPANYSITNPAADSSYRVVPVRTSWQNAAAGCLSDQIPDSPRFTHLAVLSSDDEHALLASHANQEDMWIGLISPRVVSTFSWVTAEEAAVNYPPAFGVAPWHATQPNNGDFPACVAINDLTIVPPVTTGELFDRNCQNDYTFACECDLFEDDERYLP